MLQYRNFGKKSLKEIADLLVGMGLHFGMDVSRYLGAQPVPRPAGRRGGSGRGRLDESDVEDDDDAEDRRSRRSWSGRRRELPRRRPGEGRDKT